MSGILIEAQTDTRKAERDLSSLNRQMAELVRTTNQSNIALQNSLKQDFSKLTQSINSNVKSMMQFQQAGVNANNSVAKSTQSTANSFSALNKVLAITASSFAAFQGVKVFSQMSDDLTNIQNRLKLVNDEATELAKTQSLLKKLAVDTRSAMADVTGLYTDFSLALAKSGESQTKILKVITTIQQAGALSGSSMESLRAGVTQLLQGISSGTIRGEELNSVMEQMKYLSIGIQRELNMTAGQLRNFAEQGNFTTKVFLDVVDKLSEKTAKDFAKTSATIAQGALQLKSSVSYLVGSISAMTGVGVKFANLLLSVASSINTLGESLDYTSYFIKVFKRDAETLFGNLKSSVKIFSEEILKFLNPTEGTLQALSLMKFLNNLYDNSKIKVKLAVETILATDTSYLKKLGENLVGFLQGFLRGIRWADYFTFGIERTVTTLFSKISNDVVYILSEIEQKVLNTFEKVKNFINVKLNEISTSVEEFKGRFTFSQGFLDAVAITDAVKSAFETVSKTVRKFLNKDFEIDSSSLKAFYNKMSSYLSGMFEGFKFVESRDVGLVAYVRETFNSYKQIILKEYTNLLRILEELPSNIYSRLSADDGFYDGLVAVFNIYDAFNKLKAMISAAFYSLLNIDGSSLANWGARVGSYLSAFFQGAQLADIFTFEIYNTFNKVLNIIPSIGLALGNAIGTVLGRVLTDSFTNSFNPFSTSPLLSLAENFGEASNDLRGAVYKSLSNIFDRSILAEVLSPDSMNYEAVGVSLGDTIYDIMQIAYKSAAALFQTESVVNQPILDMLGIGDTSTIKGSFDDFSYIMYDRLETVVSSLKSFTSGLTLSSDLTEALLPNKSIFETIFKLESLQLFTRRLQNWLYNFEKSLTTDAYRVIDTLTSFTSGAFDYIFYLAFGWIDRANYAKSGEMFVRNMAFQFVKYSQRVQMLVSDFFRAIVTESQTELMAAFYIFGSNIKAYLKGALNGVKAVFNSEDFSEFFELFNIKDVLIDALQSFADIDLGYQLGNILGSSVRNVGKFFVNFLKTVLVSDFKSSASAIAFKNTLFELGKNFGKFVGDFFIGLYDGIRGQDQTAGIDYVLAKLMESDYKFSITAPFDFNFEMPDISSKLSAVLEYLKQAFNEFFSKISTTFSKGSMVSVSEKLKDLFESTLSYIKSLDLSYFTKMIDKIVEKTPDLDRVKAYIKSFAEYINKLFFEMYDKIVGHSYWPDLIDGVVAETWRLEAVWNYIKAFASKVNAAFRDISSELFASVSVKASDLTYALGGVITAAIVMAFGNPLATAAGYLFYSGLFGNAGLDILQKVGEPVGDILGKMAASFTENLVSGMVHALDAITAIVPGFIDGLIKGITGLDDLEYQLTLYATGLEYLQNSIVATVVGVTAMLALVSKDFRAFAKNIILGDVVRRDKSGNVIDRPDPERRGGLLDYLGLNNMLGGFLKTFKGNFLDIFQDKRAFVVGALAFSSAFLESVNLIEAAILGIPALLYSVLGHDIASTIFSDIGSKGRKLLASMFGKEEFSMTPSKGIEGFVKRRDTMGRDYAEGNASLEDILFGKLPKVKFAKGDYLQREFDFGGNGQGDLFEGLVAKSAWDSGSSKTLRDSFNKVSDFFSKVEDGLKKGLSKALEMSKGAFTRLNSFAGGSVTSFVVSQIVGAMTGVFVDLAGISDNPVIGQAVSASVNNLVRFKEKFTSVFRLISLKTSEALSKLAGSALEWATPVQSLSVEVSRSMASSISAFGNKLKGAVSSLLKVLKTKLGVVAVAAFALSAIDLSPAKDDFSILERTKLLVADALSFFGITIETAETLKRDLLKLASKSAGLESLPTSLTKTTTVADARVLTDAISTVDLSKVSERKLDGVRSFLEEINSMAAGIEQEVMSKGFASEVSIEAYNEKINKVAQIINKLPQEALPPVEESFKTLIAEIGNVDNSFSALIARAVGLQFVGDYIDKVLLKFEEASQPIRDWVNPVDAMLLGFKSLQTVSELYIDSLQAKFKKFLKDNYSEKPSEAKLAIQERMKAAAGSNLQYLGYLSQEDQTAYRKLETRALTSTQMFNDAYGTVADSDSVKDIKRAQRLKADMQKAQKDLEDFLIKKGPVAYDTFISQTLKANIENIGKNLKENLGVEADFTRKVISNDQLKLLQGINTEAKSIEKELKEGILTDDKRNKLLERRKQLISETKALVEQLSNLDVGSLNKLIKDVSGIDFSTGALSLQISNGFDPSSFRKLVQERDKAKAYYENLDEGSSSSVIRTAYDKYLSADYSAKAAVKITSDYETISQALKDLGLDQLSYSQYTSLSSDSLKSFVESLNQARLAELQYNKTSKSGTSTRSGKANAYQNSELSKSVVSRSVEAISQLKSEGLSVYEYVDALRKKTFKDGFFGSATLTNITEYTKRLATLQKAQRDVNDLAMNRADTAEWTEAYLEASLNLQSAENSLATFAESSKLSVVQLNSNFSSIGENLAEAFAAISPNIVFAMKSVSQQVAEASKEMDEAFSENSLESIRSAIAKKVAALSSQRQILRDAINSLIGSVVSSGEYDDILLYVGVDVVKSLANIKLDIQDIRSRLALATDPFEIEALIQFKKEGELAEKVAKDKAEANKLLSGDFLTPKERYQRMYGGIDLYGSDSKRMSLESRKRQLEADIANSSGSDAELERLSKVEKAILMEKEALDRATSSARDYANIHRTASDVLNAFSKFNLSDVEISSIPAELAQEIISLDKAMQKLEVAKRNSSGSLALSINKQISELKLKEIDIGFRLDQSSLARQIASISNMFGTSLDIYTDLNLDKFSELVKVLSKSEAAYRQGDRSQDVFGMKSQAVALLQLEKSLEDSVRKATYGGLEGATAAWKSVGLDSDIFAFDNDPAMLDSIDKLSALEKTIRETSLTKAAVAMLENVDASNISEVLKGISDEMFFAANGFAEATEKVTQAGYNAMMRIKDLIKESEFAEKLSKGGLSKEQLGSLTGADKRGLSLDKSGRYEKLSTQRALAKSSLETAQKDPLTSPEKLKALQEAYDQINFETESYLEGVVTNADLARNAGATMRSGMQSTVQNTMADVLKAKTSIQEAGTAILDAFTSSVIDSFTAGVMEKLMGANSPIGMALKELGEMLVNSISSIFSDIALATAKNQVANTAFDWLGAGLSLAGSYMGSFGSSGQTAALSLAGSGSGSLGNAMVSAADASYMKSLGYTDPKWHFATGGYVSGAGTGTSDSIVARISNGEYVVNAKATAENLGLLNAINYGKVPKFATGGLVSTDVVQPSISSVNVTPVQPSNSPSSNQVFNINITGDISNQTKSEIMKMLPQIANGVNSHNREAGYRR